MYETFVYTFPLKSTPNIKEMDKIMETVVKKDTHYFINTELDHHMPISFLEQTHLSSEQSLVEYCTTPQASRCLLEHLDA
jgi:hypothetical protein